MFYYLMSLQTTLMFIWLSFRTTTLKKIILLLLFISHDRYFIDNIATSVVEVDGGVLRKFNGGYSSYLEQKKNNY